MLESLFNKVAGLSFLNRTPQVVTSDLRVTASLNEECALVQVYHMYLKHNVEEKYTQIWTIITLLRK